MPEEGDVIGPYQLERRLGAGAFGEVWLARHLDLGAEFALKIPTDPDYIRQLRREGVLTFNVRHPNIVALQHIDTHHDPPYMAMEYVAGEDLRKRLTRLGKLTVPQALAVVYQVLDALKAAHAEGILHRDLKPENILCTEGWVIKVADFGLGRLQADVAQSILLSGSVVTSLGASISGTFEYMSPEQREGREADVRDDLYAVGVLGCELLAGSRPSGLGVAKMLARAGIARAISDVIEKALDEPEFRYATAADMAADVKALLAAERARLGRGAPPPPPSKPRPSRPTVRPAEPVPEAIPVLEAYVPPPQQFPPPPPRPTPPPPPPRQTARQANGALAVLGWLVGGLFLICAIVSVPQGDAAGLPALLIAVVLIPPSSRFIEKTLGIRMSCAVKALIVFIGFLLIGALA